MIFEYDEQPTFTQSIDVVDIGNMCLKCSAALGSVYYLRTKTVMGKTSMVMFGPVVDGAEPDAPLFNGFFVNYKRFDYKESQIIKDTKSFINEPRRGIILVEEVLENKITDAFPMIMESFEINA